MTHDHSTGKDPEEFDLEALRLDPSQLEATSAKIPISVPCQKPPRHDWIRVHPTLQITVGAILLKEDRDELYIVSPAMASAVGDELITLTMYPYINRAGVVRLWPVRLPSPDGRQNEWHRTAARAAAEAQKKWVRVAANQSLGAYEVSVATNQPPDPEWPDLTLADYIRIAFHDRGRIIKDVDHPVIKHLMGRL
jgi:hypothetical protein